MELIRENTARAAELRALQAQLQTERQTEGYDDAELIAELALDEDKLARKRMQEEYEELVKMQDESSIKQEQARGATEEQIQEEAEGRDHDANLSEDVNRRKLERGKAERGKWISAITATFERIGGGVQAILNNQNKMIVAVGGMTALAAGIYTTRCSRR